MGMILTQSPLRVSLGGGGTDLPSYYRRHGGFLVAGAINKYVYIMCHTVFQKRYRLKYSEFEEVDDPRDIRHPILREALMRHWSGDPLEIASLADVPAGTGLGSSGAYAVGVLKALALGSRIATTPQGLAESACAIEIDHLGQPVGKQDQYTAAHGGICSYTFSTTGEVVVEPVAIDQGTLADLDRSLLMFFTGETRPSAMVLSDQVSKTSAGDSDMLANLDRTKAMGYESLRLLEAGDLEGYALLMHEHWMNKRERASGMSSDRVDDLYVLARRSGALGGKLVGAGGGGFLLVLTPHPDDTRKAMAAAGAQELQFSFEFSGCTGFELT